MESGTNNHAHDAPKARPIRSASVDVGHITGRPGPSIGSDRLAVAPSLTGLPASGLEMPAHVHTLAADENRVRPHSGEQASPATRVGE